MQYRILTSNNGDINRVRYILFYFILFYIDITSLEIKKFIDIKNSLSTKMNDQPSSSNNPEHLPFPVAINVRFHHLPFNSCWNVCVLHTFLNTNHIFHSHPTRMTNPPPLTIPSIYSFQLQFTPNLTKSLLIPVGMYVYFRT